MGGRWNATGFLAGGLLVFFPAFGFAENLAVAETVISIFPVTSGVAHSPATPFSRVVVLGSQRNSSMTAAIAAAQEIFRRGGITVVEGSPSVSFKEIQGPPSVDRQDSDMRSRSIGKEVGADHVLVIEITDTLVLDKEIRLNTTYLHDERVKVRGLGVESGAVVLEGSARWSQPVERAGEHIRELTAYAIARALCSTEKWEEASVLNNGRGRCRR